jgi:hypothetical protein
MRRMNTLFSHVVSVVLRLLVVAAGLVAAAAIAVLAAAFASVLLFRSGWKKLSAKSAALFGRKKSARGVGTSAARRGTSMSRMPRGDVTDVVARAPSR